MEDKSMTGTLYLFSGFSITWIILFIYLFSMVKRQKSLEIQIEKISSKLEKGSKTAKPSHKKSELLVSPVQESPRYSSFGQQGSDEIKAWP